MLIDVRTYSCHPGTLKPHLQLYAERGRAPQVQHLGEPLAFLLCETGNPNQYLHIWQFKNAADREQRRAALWADPQWLDYVQASGELGALVAQENKLMVPADFFPLLSPAS
ncbi:NIPSNAP family protein [Marinobacterium rhizophilum]|uniref:NIPSNAP family protein n=1 Tax=Marinobacterium rhizophilum TaxID=420402 RepID=A0ABY5HGA7_9GAMM|nr:NIPSNAP family protein [Marinobacterium rhizophilum]UTW11401.1 NIPSNAP family protein [Marinobacterium rhizophilum]